VRAVRLHRDEVRAGAVLSPRFSVAHIALHTPSEFPSPWKRCAGMSQPAPSSHCSSGLRRKMGRMTVDCSGGSASVADAQTDAEPSHRPQLWMMFHGSLCIGEEGRFDLLVTSEEARYGRVEASIRCESANLLSLAPLRLPSAYHHIRTELRQRVSHLAPEPRAAAGHDRDLTAKIELLDDRPA
jgi:hypothetical protein